MLRYIGNGAWLPGVPRRDLTEAEAAALGGAGTLCATGLYEEIVEPEREETAPTAENEEQPARGRRGGRTWQA